MLGYQKTIVNSGVQIWQQGTLETAQGGFTLDTTGLAAGSTLPGGTVISFDEATRKAKVVKTLILAANATNSDTVYQVKKGSQVKVGDIYAKAVGGSSQTVTAVDTSNAAYDAVTLDTTLGVALNAGDVLFQSSADGTTAGAYSSTPKGLLYEDTDIVAGAASIDIAVVLKGTVYARRIPGVPASIQALMPNIIFSQSF